MSLARSLRVLICMFNSLFDISSGILHRHLKLNIVRNKAYIPTLCLHQSVQLLCSTDQSHPLLILLDGEIKGMVYAAPDMGVQDREDSDAHFKETFPQHLTPINH